MRIKHLYRKTPKTPAEGAAPGQQEAQEGAAGTSAGTGAPAPAPAAQAGSEGAPAAPQGAATAPTPADEELKALREKVAQMEADRKKAEREAMDEATRMEAEKAEKLAELQQLDRELAFRKAGLPAELAKAIGPVEGMTAEQQAKLLAKNLQAPAPAPPAGTPPAPTRLGSPHTPVSGAAPTPDQKTPREIEEGRYATSARWGRSERKAS